ncbi:MAG: hypothetical protein IH987_13745 [Planctomycetes bacterium]|nr:hypothetical protein [Planctomycetota bacterium]
MRCSKNTITVIATGFILAIGTTAAMAEKTTVRGKVIFKGNAAKFKRTKLDTSKDPKCKMSKKSIGTYDVILNKKTDPITIRNVLVSIKSGLADRVFPTPNTPVTLTQYGCEYDPHVFGIMEGQELKILNGDETNHNIHFLPKNNDQYNFSQPKKDLEKGKTITLDAEAPFRVKCDVHPWMGCHIGVFKHPFYDVTDKLGKFEISGMGAGSYTLELWHETFGTMTADFTVAKGQTTDLDIEFEVK